VNLIHRIVDLGDQVERWDGIIGNLGKFGLDLTHLGDVHRTQDDHKNQKDANHQEQPDANF
jgi:hypothetical protein